MTTEWRGTVTCSQDPCSYCHVPARTVVLVNPSQPEYPTREAAEQHARVMARNVYGASVHRTGAVSRTVTDWN